MISYGAAVYEIARKEALQHLRTKRLLIMGSILLVSLILVTLVVPIAVFGLDEIAQESEDEPPTQWTPAPANLLFLFFLNAPVIGGVFLLIMLGIILTADSVVSEWQRKTLFLLLSKPVPRSAFVLGKFLGSAIPLVLMFSVVFLLDYLLLALITGGVDAESFLRFLGMLGLLALGTCAFAALGLLFSSLMRSSNPSFTLSVLAAIVVFPLVSSIGDFVYMSDQFGSGSGLDKKDWVYDWTHYLTPAAAINTASPALMGDEDIGFTLSFLFPQFNPARTWLAAIASSAWAVLFVGLSMLTVRRRDFE